ncbi:dienelactone hydrolase family protein [Longimicrobium terrae]|uniref:Carboxymethylenebutenolidase n=1 Tax=Longimicrobium terrae TaxID=1639882 RepID=A0A841H347_9BACT|nr:dienelactone hydrolase family protein [Longimicrobium terrae]MBB4638327.1 carboxymethylenebutenolidase [Longimicrobium terrae]MBB6072605.1 carboxymethylenebutenolidase [Longimicrobium terrae]NNC28616.1 prolyl oligopeptidase family serine peptidase [Longimicrobium terrae]
MRISRWTALSAALLLGACATAEPRPATAGANAVDRAHLDAMSHEHAGETPTPNGSAMEPRQDVVAQDVEYLTVDGKAVRGYEARPANAAVGAKLPSIIVIHEWYGLNDNVRMMTRRLAGEGYRAFAVDMYNGQVASNPDEARMLMGGVMENPQGGTANLAAAARSLETRTGADRIAILGWCFGGAWSLEGALSMPAQIDAAVMYYGRPVTDRARLAGLRAPLLGLFGGADQGIPVAQVRQMETTLRELNKDVTIQVYEGAGHAFANPSGQSYNAVAAEDSWMRTTAFLARHLR